MFPKSTCLVIFLGVLCSVPHAEATADETLTNILQDLVKIIGSYLNITINHELQNLPQPLLNLNLRNIADVNGTLNATSTRIDGLQTINLRETPKFSQGVISINGRNGNCYNISAKLAFANLSISLSNYSMDMALYKLLPLYGEGNISLGVNEIGFEVDTSLAVLKDKDDHVTMSIIYLKPLITFRHSKIFISGFWMNDKLSEYLTDIFTLFESVVAMFWNYNVERISCVLGDIARDFINTKIFKVEYLVPSQCENVSEKVRNALLRAKENRNMAEFLILLEESHVKLFVEFMNDQLAAFSSRV